MLSCKDMDEVYTIDDFMTCFNLQDKGAQIGENYIFIPDVKFKKQIGQYFEAVS